MKLVSVTKILGLVITLTLLAPTLAKSDKHHNCEVVKFVKGGAPAGGDGSRKHPYNLLQTAQADASWDVLVVLSSSVALTDGIILSGRNLIGEDNPTCITLSAKQPTLSTHGVTVVGNAIIENISFQNMTGSAINFDKAENLTVKNVRINNFNTAKSTSSSASGITATSINPGKTRLEHVIISTSNSTSTPGVYELAKANRELDVEECELFALSSTGIHTQPTGSSIRYSLSVVDCYLHDFIGSPLGILCSPDQAIQTAFVKNSVFNNIGAGTTISYQPTDTASFVLKVDTCRFEETTANTGTAIEIISINSLSELSVENSTCTNMATFFKGILDDTNNEPSSIQKNILCGNKVSAGTFYQTTNTSTSTSNPRVAITQIKENTFTGLTGVLITQTGTLYKLLDIIFEHNCFTGTGPGSFGFHTTSNFNVGNAVIKAHCNSISNFATDINDAGSNVNYLVSRNFWGQPTASCSSSTPCPGKYQICQNNLCLGPTTSLGTSGHPFTGFVDANDPLAQSIKCPEGCC